VINQPPPGALSVLPMIELRAMKNRLAQMEPDGKGNYDILKE